MAEQNISDVLSTNLWDDNPNTPKIVLCFFRGVGQDNFQESDRLNYIIPHNILTMRFV